MMAVAAWIASRGLRLVCSRRSWALVMTSLVGGINMMSTSSIFLPSMLAFSFPLSFQIACTTSSHVSVQVHPSSFSSAMERSIFLAQSPFSSSLVAA